MLQRNYVGDVVEANETDDGLAIKGRFDPDTEFGKSAYRNTKGRRLSGLSTGSAIRNATKNLRPLDPQTMERCSHTCAGVRRSPEPCRS